MIRLTINLSDTEDALLLEELVMRMPSVANIHADTVEENSANVLAEPTSVYGEKSIATTEDWVRPGRPASEEELRTLIAEGERQYSEGEFSGADDVRMRLDRKIASWRAIKEK